MEHKFVVPQSALKLLGAHPFLCAFFACMFLTPLCFGAESNVPAASVLAVMIFVAAATLIILYHAYKCDHVNKSSAVLFAAGLLILYVQLGRAFSQTQAKGIWFFYVIIAFVILSMFFVVPPDMPDGENLSEKLNSLWIILAGFAIKLFYILTTSVYVRQNDVGAFGANDEGHAAYIEYYLFNKQLPDFDIRDHWQFYHPPLYHIICAGWIDVLENFFKVDHNWARESLQMLTLFYSTACVILVYKILRYFRLKGVALYAPLAVFAVHPSFILLSGSINNDILSITFILAAVWSLLCWYSEPTIKNILKIALAVGLGMMTKLSAALVAPPIAFVFIVMLIKKRENFGKLFAQFGAFALVCCPLGLWWSVRNYVKFKVPFDYVPSLTPESSQYVGDKSIWQRLTDFSSYQFASPFEQWTSRESYSEFNPNVALMKNSLFGESLYEPNFPKEYLFIVKLFFWIGTAFALISIVLMIVSLFKKHERGGWVLKVFFTLFYVLLMFNFYSFCSKYPYTCTQNFRYVAPLLLNGVLAIGLTIQDGCNSQKAAQRAVSKSVIALSGVFALMSVLVYYFLCSSIAYD